MLRYIMLTAHTDLRPTSFIDNPGFNAGRSIGLRGPMGPVRLYDMDLASQLGVNKPYKSAVVTSRSMAFLQISRRN